MYVDSREPESYLRMLKYLGIPVEVKQLEVGDYIFGNVIVERKTVSDFLNSLFRGRLWKQLEEMKKQKDAIPILIVLGDYPKGKQFNIFLGAVSSIVLKWRIPVVVILGLERDKIQRYFSSLLSSLYVKITMKSRGKQPLLLSRKGYDLEEIRVNMLCCIPKVGINKAMSILEKYPDFLSLSQASVEDLSQIKGVSRKLAELIKKVMIGEVNES